MDNFKKVFMENKILLIDFLVSRFFLFTFLYICSFASELGNLNEYLSKLWDCEHYIDIATNGYNKEYLYAFFPLLPILLKIIKPMGVIILNQILTLLITYMFFDISNFYLKTSRPLNTCRLWIWSPIAVFTIIYYTETLFLFLTLFSFYLYKKEKYHILCGIMLGLSVMCRSTGSLLFFTLFIFMFIKFLRKKEKFINILKVYIPATIISCIYPIYLQIQENNWKLFVDIQYSYWEKEHCNLFSIIPKIKIISEAPKITQPLFYADFILTMLLIFIIIILSIKKIKNQEYLEIITFMLLTIVIVTSTCKFVGNPIVSYYRYLFGTFSLILLLPQKKWLVNIFKILSLFIAFVFLAGIYFY